MLDRICPDWESDSNVHIRREGCRRRLKNKTREIDGKPTISTQPCKSKHSFPSIVPHYHTLLLSTPIIPPALYCTQPRHHRYFCLPLLPLLPRPLFWPIWGSARPTFSERRNFVWPTFFRSPQSYDAFISGCDRAFLQSQTN